MSTNTGNKKNVLLVFGALAVVLVAVFVIWRPPALRTEDASGAIGAVQKHHQTQITPQDVVLGDEQAKVEQNVEFGDQLNDAAKLQSISAEFGAIAASKADASRANAAAKNLGDIDAELQARYARYASSFVTAAQRIAARSADAKLQADIADLGTKLNTKLNANDMDAMNARMGLIVVICSKLDARGAAEAKVAEAMSALQSRSPEAASKINAAADSLDSRNAGASLDSIHAALESITMESKAINAAQSRLLAKSADSKVYDSISSGLAQNAVELETRGLNNLAARLGRQVDLGIKLAAIDAQLNAKSASINMASAAANRSDNISAAASRLEASLAGAKADYAAKSASMINLASASLDARMDARSAENRNAYNRALAGARDLAARPEIAARLDAKVQSRFAAKSE